MISTSTQSISSKDGQLIEAAAQLLEKRYSEPLHTVAAAARLRDGSIVTAMNSHHFNAFVCAEMAVLDSVINNSESQIDVIVAVHYGEDQAIEVFNPCGKCRQIFFDYTPDTNCIVDDNGTAKSVKINDLLPYACSKREVIKDAGEKAA